MMSNTKKKDSLTSAAIYTIAITVFRPLLQHAKYREQPVPISSEAGVGKVDYCKLPGPPPRRRRHTEWD
jgi:hypothetical protein